MKNDENNEKYQKIRAHQKVAAFHNLTLELKSIIWVKC